VEIVFRKKLRSFLAVVVVVFVATSAQAQGVTGAQMLAAQDSVTAQIKVLKEKCNIEKARIEDIRNQFIKIDQAHLMGRAKITDSARLAVIAQKLVAQKMRILNQILPAACLAELSAVDLQRLTGDTIKRRDK
jgi:hypothetical protein